MHPKYKSEVIATGGFFGSSLPDNFDDILNARAAEGLEFVTAIPNEVSGQGGISSVRLVFKKSALAAAREPI